MSFVGTMPATSASSNGIGTSLFWLSGIKALSSCVHISIPSPCTAQKTNIHVGIAAGSVGPPAAYRSASWSIAAPRWPAPPSDIGTPPAILIASPCHLALARHRPGCALIYRDDGTILVNRSRICICVPESPSGRGGELAIQVEVVAGGAVAATNCRKGAVRRSRSSLSSPAQRLLRPRRELAI